MSRRFTEDEVLEAVAALSRPRLTTWLEARIVRPELTEAGARRYREVDIARLQTLCDLDESYQLQADALAMVMSLLDQLGALRLQRDALLEGLSAEAPEVRGRIRTVIAARMPARQ